jgi:hypothetical protein
LAAVVVALLMLAALAAGTPAVASTHTLSPAEESALPTADPSHIIPGQILVQFSRSISGAELTSFETRFHLTYMSDSEFGDGRPYYQFHIDDGMNPPDKRLQILGGLPGTTGEPLVTWCGPNIRVELEAGQPASNQSPTGSPSPTASPSATAPLASSAPAFSASPGGPPNSDPGSSLPLAAIALIAVIAAVACLVVTAVLVRRRRGAA